MFATTMGSALISSPYPIHSSAARPCTPRSVLGLLQKYELANTAVATQPIQLNISGFMLSRQLGTETRGVFPNREPIRPDLAPLMQ